MKIVIEKTADEMKSREMLKTLGDKFTSDYDDVNHGYPVFIWQVSSDNMHKIAEDAIDAIGTVTLDSEEAIAERVDKAEEEMTYADRFDHILVNDDLATSFREAEKVVDDFLRK